MSGSASFATAIPAGLRLVRRSFVPVGAVYAVGFGFSLPFALTVGTLVHGFAGSSASVDDFARRVDPILIAAFFRAHGDTLLGFVPALLGLGLLWIVTSSFTSAALAAEAISEEPTRVARFIERGAKSFGTIFRTSVLGLVFQAAVIAGAHFGTAALTKRLMDGWVSEKAVLSVELGRVALVLGLAFWANGCADMMRLSAVALPERRARRAFVRGLSAALRRPGSIFLVVACFGLLSALVIVLGTLVDVRVPRSGAVLIGCGFVVEQLVLIGRSAAKVAQIGALASFAPSRRAQDSAAVIEVDISSPDQA